MANKRILKKQIHNVCGDFAGEAIVARDLIPGFDYEKMTDIVLEIANLQIVTIKRISISFSKSAKDFANKKEYNRASSKYFKEAFSKLKEDFYKQARNILAEMNKQMPDKVKEANKAK